MPFLRWIKDNRHAFIIFCLLCLVTFFTIVRTFISTDMDLRITKVRSERLSEAFLYKVNLKATGQVNSPTDLLAIFEDGTQEKIEWGSEHTHYQIDLKSSKRLEYLLLSNLAVHEKNLQNNGKSLSLWSDPLALYEGYSVPEYAYLTDHAGRFWLATAGRLTPDARPSLTLTVLSPNGEILLDHKQLSAENWFNRYPILREVNDQIHLIWSGYETEGERRQLFHTVFSISNEIFMQSTITAITDPKYSLLRPVVASDNLSDPLILVEVAEDLRGSFCVYRLTDHGLTRIGLLHNPSGNFVASEMIKDATLLTVDDGTYHLAWTQQHYYTNIYYTRLTIDGEMLVPATYLSANFSNSQINQLSVVPCGNLLYYFWSYASMRNSTIYHVYFMVTDFKGEIIRDRTILLGPSLTPLRDISVALDANGNFDMIWVDGRYSASRPMVDLVFQKMSPDLETLVPAYRITTDAYTEMTPLLTSMSHLRTLTWKTYDEGKFRILMKSTDPQLVSALKQQHRFKETIQRFWDITWATLASLGLQVFFILPLNFAALISALVFAILFATNRLKNNLITWGSILLGILLAKLYSFHAMANQLGQFHLIELADCYKISLLTLALALSFYWITSRFSRNKSSNELRFLFLMIWFFLDSFVLLFVDNLLMLS